MVMSKALIDLCGVFQQIRRLPVRDEVDGNPRPCWSESKRSKSAYG